MPQPDHIALKAGESVRVATAGGAGYGPPSERDLERLATDIRGGRVSRGAAERDYGADRVTEALGKDAARTAAQPLRLIDDLRPMPAPA